MLRSTLLVFAVFAGFGGFVRDLCAQAQEASNVVKAFDAWLRAYRKGTYVFLEPVEEGKKPGARAEGRDISKESVLTSYGLTKGELGRLTRRREIEILLKRSVEENSPAAAQRVLATAAIGLDQIAYPVNAAPHVVRSLGEAAIVKFTSPEAKDAILQAGRERKETGDGKDVAVAVQAAALRALGAYGEPAFRPTLEGQLVSADERLRVAAADGLPRLALPASVDALANSLAKETKDSVLDAMVAALHRTIEKHEKEVPAAAARMAMQAAIAALGRGGWRTDLALIDFLARFRSAEVVPAMIGVLERFAGSLDDVKAGKLSTLLRHRAQDALVALTGSFHPADKPEEWRAWWEKTKTGFQVAPAKESASAQGKGGTVTKGFFGIPVEGSRIVFVVDVSGSMKAAFPHREGGTTAAGKDQDRVYTRLDAARDNLIETITALPEETKFNIVKFSEGVEPWNKELVAADAKNKKSALEYVKKMKPETGTNFWAGLKRGLEIKSLVYGSRYDSNVDEVFVLSDGLPSVGEVIDPEEILKLVAETNRVSHVRINAVYLGSEGSQLDGGRDGGPFMERLAKENGGKFVRKADK